MRPLELRTSTMYFVAILAVCFGMVACARSGAVAPMVGTPEQFPDYTGTWRSNFPEFNATIELRRESATLYQSTVARKGDAVGAGGPQTYSGVVQPDGSLAVVVSPRLDGFRLHFERGILWATPREPAGISIPLERIETAK